MAFVCFVGYLLPATPAHAATEFVRVWPAWRDADTFERIGEYFGKPESTGREIILRTQPPVRDGYYFLVRVKTDEAPSSAAAARFELKVIRPDKPEAQTYTFPATLSGKETVFHLGLTGADWPGKATNPVAWKLSLLAADNRVLAEHKSFLWEKPSK